jgi:hypothetical protein
MCTDHGAGSVICTHRTQAHGFTCCYNIDYVHADEHGRTISVVFSQVLGSSLRMVPVWTETRRSECHNCNFNYFIIWDFILLRASVGTIKSSQTQILLLLLPLALQPTVGFGLSNNILPFFPICHQLSPSPLHPSSFFLCSTFVTISFYCVGMLAPRQTPNLEDQGIPFCLGHHPWPVWHGRPYQ